MTDQSGSNARHSTQPKLKPGELHPVSEIADGVWGLRLLMVNVYLIREGGRWILVDAGLPFTRGFIKRWVRRLMGPDRHPEAIVLTHGHFDHVGALPGLAEEWNTPVWAHQLEQPFLTGERPYPDPDPTVGRGVMSLLSPLYPKGPIDLGGRQRVLAGDGSVAGLREWQWVATPGHAPGHVSFFRERDRVLIAGDAFNTTRQESLFSVMTQRFWLEGPPAYFTPDWVSAGESVACLARLQPRVAAVGHGRALHGDAPARCLEYLSEHFAEIGLPRQGRYLPQNQGTLRMA